MNSLITNNVKRRRITINSIVPNDMEKMFTTLANSDVLIKSKFLTRNFVQHLVIKYVETAKIEEPFTNSCEITCWWKKFIKFVESTNNLLKMNPSWKNLSYEDDDVSTVPDSDEETVIDTSDEKRQAQTLPNVTQTFPSVTQTFPTLKRSHSNIENYSDDEDSYVNNKMDTGFARKFEEQMLKLSMVQKNKKPAPKVQVRLPPKQQTITHQQQTITNQQQTISPQQQTISLESFVDFCKYDFNCLNEQCNRKHSAGVKPSRYNKMCRDGIYCKYILCSYRH
jgi:hypothetical protein